MEGKRFYMLMLFYSDWDLGGQDRDVFVNTKNLTFNDGGKALDYYANIPCPASQLIEASTLEELNKKKEEMLKNFEDKDWLKENILKSI